MSTQDTQDTQVQPQFELGQMVKAVSFVDCFGKLVPETPNLIVTKVTLIVDQHPLPLGVAPYYRIVAEGLTDRTYIEGAERYFARQDTAPIVLSFYGDDKPIRIDATRDGQGMTAVLMPLRGTDDLPGTHGYEEREAHRVIERAEAARAEDAAATQESSPESSPLAGEVAEPV